MWLYRFVMTSVCLCLSKMYATFKLPNDILFPWNIHQRCFISIDNRAILSTLSFHRYIFWFPYHFMRIYPENDIKIVIFMLFLENRIASCQTVNSYEMVPIRKKTFIFPNLAVFRVNQTYWRNKQPFFNFKYKRKGSSIPKITLWAHQQWHWK